MSDKEPRRRKRRRDGQRKEDLNSEEQSFVAQKQEMRDSDQENEEEAVVIAHHEPSKIAKIIFVLLSSALVIGMSTVFIALHGTERGPIDVFEDDHHELHQVSSDKHEEVEVDMLLPEYADGTEIPDVYQDITEHLEEIAADTENEDQMLVNEKHEYISEAIKINMESNEDDTQPYDEEKADKIYGEELQPEEHTYVSEPLTLMNDEITAYQEIQEDALSSEEDEDENAIPKEEESKVLGISDDIEPLSHSYVTETQETDDIVISHLSQHKKESELPQQDLEVDDANKKRDQQAGLEDEHMPNLLFPFYEKADITSEDDENIQEKLDDIDRILDKSPEKALERYEDLLLQYPNSPRANYGRSQALDQLADVQRSNKILEEAIASYQKVMSLRNVPDKLFLLSGNRAVERMRFRGFVGKSLKLEIEMVKKFPDNIDLLKRLAVGYLLIGQNSEAKKILIQILKQAPECGFAKVHLGFILKIDDANYGEAIKLMTEGIASREPGVIDGRFFFHLGDALSRTGNQTKAMKVYEEGVKENVFLSVYQRSLYNVEGLTGKPWWSPQNTPYSAFILQLESNWIIIRNEALALVDSKSSGFISESEGLQDKGDWKQFELFARGNKLTKNCEHAPRTCALIQQMPDAAECKRGQVKFSIMQPGTHVWAHTGPTNCRLRTHLGLVVPKNVKIRVANETRSWQEGKVIMFDDSFEHEVWHNGNSLRLVLIVDFWHPELTTNQKRALTPI